MRRMNNKTLLLALSFLFTVSCDFSKSVYKDLQTGMVIKGDGLSCEEVYLTIGEETIHRNTFTYGEKLNLNFNNIEGFERLGNHVFPGMNLSVVSQNGDTMIYNQDLYAGLTDGTDHTPLLLTSDVVLADPIHSNETYTLFIRIWDKKGDGVFTAKLDFNVVPNDQIEIVTNGISYQEIYLYSQQRGNVITDNTAFFDENVYIIFEGLEGLVKEGEMISAGMSLSLKDAAGNLILNEADLLGTSEYKYSDIHARLSANFIVTGSEINNPVLCEVTIWDKRGDDKLKASAQIQIK